MRLDPFRSLPRVRHPSFAISRRLEWALLLISMVLSGIGVAMFWLSVDHRFFSSPRELVAAEGAVVVAQMVLLRLASFARRRGLG